MKQGKTVKGSITQGTAITAAIVCSCITATAVWAVLDGPAQSLIIDNGNIADWTAAIGTWAVGVGAGWYAREAQQLRMKEVRDARLDRLEHRLFQVRNFLQTTESLCYVADLFENDGSDKAVPIKKLTFAANCLTLEEMTKGIDWASLSGVLRDEVGIDALTALQNNVSSFWREVGKALPKAADVRSEDLPWPLVENLMADFREIKDLAGSVVLSAKVLRSGLLQEIADLEARN